MSDDVERLVSPDRQLSFHPDDAAINSGCGGSDSGAGEWDSQYGGMKGEDGNYYDSSSNFQEGSHVTGASEDGDEEDSIAVQIRQEVARLQIRHEEQEKEIAEARREKAHTLISRVIKSPFDRNKKIIMLKAFIKWAKQIPLHQKCDELAYQLQDRLTAIASIRDSYLRDVVRVKYHLSKVKEFKFPGETEEAFQKLSGHDMYVCVCVRVCVCVSLCVYTCMCLHLFTFPRTNSPVYLFTSQHTHIGTTCMWFLPCPSKNS